MEGRCEAKLGEEELMEGRCEPTLCVRRGNFFTREAGAVERLEGSYFSRLGGWVRTHPPLTLTRAWGGFAPNPPLKGVGEGAEAELADAEDGFAEDAAVHLARA